MPTLTSCHLLSMKKCSTNKRTSAASQFLTLTCTPTPLYLRGESYIELSDDHIMRECWNDHFRTDHLYIRLLSYRIYWNDYNEILLFFFAWYSNAFCSLTGYTREEIILRNCRFLQVKILPALLQTTKTHILILFKTYCTNWTCLTTYCVSSGQRNWP